MALEPLDPDPILPASLAADVQSLAPSAVIELFELSVNPEITDDPTYATPVRFHSGISLQDQNIVWQGNTYTRFPVEFTGFDQTGKGTIPRPQVKVANIGGAISSLLYTFDNLIGAKVTRKRTLYKYLDAVNYPNGQNPQANPSVGFPDEVYYVSRKVVETGVYVELELSPSWDLHGIKLPRRLCTQNICMWKYKGIECGYGEIPVLVRQNQSFVANLSTGITVTSVAHGLNTGDGIYLQFSGELAPLSKSYIVSLRTTDTFTVRSKTLASSTTGTVNITNRFRTNDQPITDPAEVSTFDRCGKRLSSCRLRYGDVAIIPYGAFPAVGWIR